jgi:hypothetical protein
MAREEVRVRRRRKKRARSILPACAKRPLREKDTTDVS